MVDYVVTSNFGNAVSIIVRMNTLMGYPNSPTKTVQYAIAQVWYDDRNIPAPGLKRHIVIVKEVWAPTLGRNATVIDINGELTPAELNTITSQEEVRTQGGLPPFDEP